MVILVYSIKKKKEIFYFKLLKGNFLIKDFVQNHFIFNSKYYI